MNHRIVTQASTRFVVRSVKQGVVVKDLITAESHTLTLHDSGELECSCSADGPCVHMAAGAQALVRASLAWRQARREERKADQARAERKARRQARKAEREQAAAA